MMMIAVSVLLLLCTFCVCVCARQKIFSAFPLVLRCENSPQRRGRKRKKKRGICFPCLDPTPFFHLTAARGPSGEMDAVAVDVMGVLSSPTAFFLVRAPAAHHVLGDS